MKFNLIVIATCLVLIPFQNSFAYGGSNLDFSGYPEFREMEPMPPYDKDEYSVQNYSFQVDEYVNKAKRFIENGNNDIDTIKKEQKEAIDKANRVVDDFNLWLKN